MTEELTQKVCEPCRSGGNKALASDIESWMSVLPEWQVNTENDIQQLIRVFKFKNFRQALAFTNQVGDIAEKDGHHPGLLTEWGKVTVTWWTHAVSGLHKNDFIMAAKTDALLLNK